MERHEMKILRYGLTKFEPSIEVKIDKSFNKKTEFRIVYGEIKRNQLPLIFKFAFNDEEIPEILLGDGSTTIVLDDTEKLPESSIPKLVQQVVQSILFPLILKQVKLLYSIAFEEAIHNPHSLPYWSFEQNINFTSKQLISSANTTKDNLYMYAV